MPRAQPLVFSGHERTPAQRALLQHRRALPKAVGHGADGSFRCSSKLATKRTRAWEFRAFRGICTSANKTPRVLPKIGAPTPPEIEHHFLYEFLLEMNIFVKKIGVWRRAPILGAACPTVARRKRRARRVRRRPKRYARHEHRRSPTALDRRSAPKVRSARCSLVASVDSDGRGRARSWLYATEATVGERRRRRRRETEPR